MEEEQGEWGMYYVEDFMDYLNSSNNFTGFNFTPIGSREDPGINWKDFIWIAIFYGLVFLLGVIGNSLVIYCIAKYKRMKSITNQLLMSLAMADLLLILVCVPIRFAELFSYSWSCGAVLCKLVYYTQTCSMVTSVLTLTTISIERYYAISRPLRAKYMCTTQHARIVILALWFSSSVLSLPILFVQEHYAVGQEDNRLFWCNKRWDELGIEAAISFEVYMLIILFALPVIVMVCAYSGVCRELWAVTGTAPVGRKLTNDNAKLGDQLEELMSANEKKSSSSSKFSAESKFLSEQNFRKAHLKEAQIRKQVLHMLLMVVALFIICWGPLLSLNLAVASEAILPYLPTVYPYAKTLKTVFSLLAYFNSCLNPIVYGFMSRYFRKSFKQALATCCMLNNSRSNSFVQTPYMQNDRSSSTIRRREDALPADAATKRNTMSTTAADSTLSRSPPVTPDNTCPRL